MMKKFKEILSGIGLIVSIISIMIFGAACKTKEMEEIQKPTEETIITENIIVENTLVE